MKAKMQPKTISQAEINEFVHLKAEEAKIQKQLKVMRDQFVERMTNGEVCDISGPYLIEMGEREDSFYSWKEIFEQTIALAPAKLGAKMVEYAASLLTVKKKTTVLRSVTNPNFNPKP